MPTSTPCRRASGLVLAALLVLLVAAPAFAAPADPNDETSTLERRLQEALARKDYSAALDIAGRLNDVVEQRHVDLLYQIARLHALLGHADEMYAWIERAHATGYVNVYEMRKDEAFAAFRDEERYRKLTKEIWAKGYIAMLERPERESFQKPDQVMAALALRPGERVADIGAGSGYFTVRAARAVGPTGLVWAIDISQEMLDHLGKRLQAEKLENVRVAKVAADDPQLPPAGVDTILMVDTLHYIKDRAAYARRLRAGLAPGGRVVVIDYIPKSPEERPWGPPPEQKMSREEVDAAMAAAGMTPARVHEFLPEQFFVEYRPAEASIPPR